MNYEDFDVFKSQLIISGELETLTNLHIGSGKESANSKNAVLKLKKGSIEFPYIPGSSLKGVFRSTAEAWLRSIDVHVCEPTTNDICKPDKNGGEYCPICGTFGGFNIASHVRLTDGIPIEKNVPLNVKPGVAINRILGVAYSGALTDFECVNPGVDFSFSMIIDNINIFQNDKIYENPDDKRTSVIINIIKQLMIGNFSIGGKTSSGLGMVKLKNVTALLREPGTENKLFNEKLYRLSIDNNLNLEANL